MDAPSTPGRSEVAFPVAGGWVQVVVESSFTSADEVTAPEALRAAADTIRTIDPQAIREAVEPLLTSLASDPYRAARDVIADMVEAS